MDSKEEKSCDVSAGLDAIVETSPSSRFKKQLITEKSDKIVNLEKNDEDKLMDNFFRNILVPSTDTPQNLKQVYEALSAKYPTTTKSFLVGDGAHFPLENPHFRFIVASGPSGSDIFVVGSQMYENNESFLQVLSWDSNNGNYHFYARIKPDWVWNGSSQNALELDTKGFGPFDGHISGSMVMKELTVPWQSWQSQVANIVQYLKSTARNHPIATGLSGAEDLQLLVQGGVRRWINSRFSSIKDTLNPTNFMTQLLDTNSINISSSATSIASSVDNVALPHDFFYNSQALSNLDILITAPSPTVSMKIYVESVNRIGLKQKDGRKGDCYFAFPVPVPAFEDTEIIFTLVNEKIVSQKFLASLLMVDFYNPVYSEKRKSLLNYVPNSISKNNGQWDLEEKMLGELEKKDPKHEFFEYYNVTDWQKAFATIISDYMNEVNKNLLNIDTMVSYQELADSRRNKFRETKLFEFDYTFPDPLNNKNLFMNKDGKVEKSSHTEKIEARPALTTRTIIKHPHRYELSMDEKALLINTKADYTLPSSPLKTDLDKTLPKQHAFPTDDDKLPDNIRNEWDIYIEKCMNSYKVWFDQPNYCPQWYNNLHNNIPGPSITQEIFWKAFPKKVQTEYPNDLVRWKMADENRLACQDEYCEWWVQKDSKGKVVAVTFTCENPEYWQLMFSTSESKDIALELYGKFLGHPVKEDDLLDENGRYNIQNKYNKDSQNGVIHLAQVNNTLGAEIDIAARATLVREKADKSIITDPIELIKCSKFGNEGRFSDPHIGDSVNTIARSGYMISLAEPTALYIRGLTIPPGSWWTPDNEDPNSFWKVVRGTESHAVRCEFRVPEKYKYVVGDIKINNRNIMYGGQLADFITIKLTGEAKNKDDKNIKTFKGCYNSD